MDTNEYTTVGFRAGSTDCTKHSNDVGMLLSHQVHYRTAHYTDESEVHNPDGYKHQINRSAEVDATRSKSIGIKCSNIGNIYN